MALPPWTIELLRRGISDVARKASEPQTLSKIKSQATEILQDLPETAARGIDAVMRSAEAGKQTVERWSRKHTAIVVPMMNASGVLLTDLGSGVPLAGVVGEVGREFMAGDVICGPLGDERLSRRIERLLPAGGDYSMAIASNFPAALTAFSLLVQQTQLVIHRNHSVRLPDGTPLPEAFGMLLPVIQEVGAVGSVSASDFAGLENFCAILADSGSQPVELLDLGERSFLQAVVLPVATLSSSAQSSIPSAEALLAKGADFVIFPGDGIGGGPPCGIIVGRREAMEVIESSAAWAALAASDAIKAMMTVALETASTNEERLPIRALLHTSEENLRGRAERMATRLSGSDAIASCQVSAEDARLTPEGRWRFPSRQLRLRHKNHSAEKWASLLREELPAVIATTDGEDLKIDLRWIAAAEDGKLAALLAGRSTGEGDTAETASQDKP